MILTMGATSVATGMRHKEYLIAVLVGAFSQHIRRKLCSAPLHGVECFFMTGQDTVSVAGKKTFFKLVDNRA